MGVHLLVETKNGNIEHRGRATVCSLVSRLLLLPNHELLLQMLLFKQVLGGRGGDDMVTRHWFCSLLLLLRFLDHEALTLASVVLRRAGDYVG